MVAEVSGACGFGTEDDGGGTADEDGGLAGRVVSWASAAPQIANAASKMIERFMVYLLRTKKMQLHLMRCLNRRTSQQRFAV
jgi:hypothetical protein